MADSFKKTAAGGAGRRSDGDKQWGSLPQALQMGQAMPEQDSGLGQGERFVIEGGQQVEHYQRGRESWSGFESCYHLMSCESALKVNMLSACFGFGGMLAQEMSQAVRLEAIASIDHL